MQAVINPGYINGTVKVPGSKSMTQRAYAAALLHTGTTIVRNPGTSADDMAALHVIQQLGAKVHTLANNELEIISHGVQPVSDTIDCGESGLCARLFSPIAAISHLPVTITGSGSLLQRPMDTYKRVFEQLQVTSADFTGQIPFTVHGPLKVQDVNIDGSLSSQFLSGLLFAYAFTAHESVTITANELKSTPYIDLTLSILEQYGKTVTHDNYKSFHIQPSVRVESAPVVIDIESDWSSAAYWLAAGALSGDVTVSHMNIQSLQADRAILEVLTASGAQVSFNGDSITVKKNRLRGFEFDATNAPDLFPILAVLAAYANGESYITGLHRLWHKESNRAESIAEMLLSLEAFFSLEDDTLCITGNKQLTGGYVESCKDHRIVMAAAIAGTKTRNALIINGCEAVNKSYPDFFSHLQALHIGCSFNEE
jgi:3-phosphoshikimate 1-carboxyvinyltransferase